MLFTGAKKKDRLDVTDVVIGGVIADDNAVINIILIFLLLSIIFCFFNLYSEEITFSLIWSGKRWHEKDDLICMPIQAG